MVALQSCTIVEIANAKCFLDFWSKIVNEYGAENQNLIFTASDHRYEQMRCCFHLISQFTTRMVALQSCTIVEIANAKCFLDFWSKIVNEYGAENQNLIFTASDHRYEQMRCCFPSNQPIYD